MNCLAHLVKYILWAFNVAFVLCGIALITIGSIMLASLNDYNKFDDVYDPKTLPILMIILGSIIFVVSFFGCCGAIRENTCCIYTYSLFMFIIFVLQLALVIWMFVQSAEFLKTMTNILDEAWKHNEAAKGYPMDTIQVTFKCCGYDGYKDWGNNVPPSCCGQLPPFTPASKCPAAIYESKPNCYDTYRDFWKTNINVVKYVGIIIALVEFAALTFACCLASSIKKSRGY